MAKSIHLICRRRDDNQGFLGVSPIKPGVFRSVAWELSQEEAEVIVGGWVYFHPTKAAASYFGGKIVRVEPTDTFTSGEKPEVALVFKASAHGRDQKWRGASHGRAWTGGVVDGDLSHEKEVAHA